MKKSIFGILLLAVLALTSLVWYGCTKDDEEKSSKNSLGSIYGTVTDYATGNPVGNVNIRLRPSGESKQTGSDGYYEFNDLEADNYSLFLSKAEYNDIDDDRVIKLDAGKKIRRDFQIIKQVATLRITDLAGDDIRELDFGSEENVTSRAFNIHNNGTKIISCQIIYDCPWISSVTNISGAIEQGKTETITVRIDRSRLEAGENRTIIQIRSGNGSNELTVIATRLTSAPTVTLDTSDVTATSVHCVGNITEDHGFTVTDRGFCFSQSHTPTIDDYVIVAGDGSGSFSGDLTDLTKNTTYHIRAFAINEMGTGYSNEIVVTTVEGLPSVTLLPVQDQGVRAITAVCEGNVTDDAGYEVSDRGFCWSTSHTPTMSNSHLSVNSGLGQFSGTLTNLRSNTTYYVRAYATNRNGTAYSSEERSFTTKSGEATVTLGTIRSENITATSVQCEGNVTNNGGYEVTERGFCWSTSHTPTTSDHKKRVNSGNGSFTGTITDLEANTTYRVRAYAINEISTVYSEERSFTTLSGLPTVTTTRPTISNSVVTTGGTVSNPDGATIIARGVCYGSAPNPELSNSPRNFTNEGANSSSGSFTSRINLPPNSGRLYIRAYAATEDEEIVYGDEVDIINPYDELPSFSYGGHTYKCLPASGLLTYSSANSYANGRTDYGFSDWRLPDDGELAAMCSQGLLDTYTDYWSSYYYNDGIFTIYHYARPYVGCAVQENPDMVNFTAKAMPIRINR